MSRFLLLSFFILSFTYGYVSVNNTKTLVLKKTTSEISIDGKIDMAWALADSTKEFFQFLPEHGKTPRVKTVAKVLTDDENLYCLIICYERKENIEAKTGLLDQHSGDAVSIMLDTFGDKRTAYKLGVSASGVRNDSRLLDDARNRDYNWDGIWFAESKIYDWGYVVEIQVPYKSIQYDKTLSEWGLDFDRWVPDRTEDLYWCEYEQNEGQRISKFGKLILNDFKPSTEGLNLEIYPVGIGRATHNEDNSYDTEADIGLDVFYNPSPQLTYQMTVNPDYAQIEADPFNFNISRYESYFSERRPFFTQGNEVFMAAGKERGSGFYSPLELFYSRRIGKVLPDGQMVPLTFGTKAFGRINDWDYGGFVAMTGEQKYYDEDEEAEMTEQKAYFGVARLKKQILGNSTIGVLFAGKHTADKSYGVIDIDGAFRGSNWQLAYQFARSFDGSDGDFAFSAGFRKSTENWVTFIKSRHVGENFDVSEIGFVPWTGTTNFVGLTGPIWYFENGPLKSFMIYGGPSATYEKVDEYTDYSANLGFNFNFKNNSGFEVNLDAGKARDEDIEYSNYSVNFSSWFSSSATWNGNVWGGYTKTYNFSREYLGYYGWIGSSLTWKPVDILEVGADINSWLEFTPDKEIDDITYNARPYFSLTPFNDLNVRVFVDNLYKRSSDRMEQVVVGFLFSYNFSPKSWIYFALNEIQSVGYNDNDEIIRGMHVKDRVGVLKLKYLYYF